MLVSKSWSVRKRVRAVLLGTTALVLFGVVGPCVGAARGWWGWPQPSSWYGVALGLVGGLIVLFEMALYPRKLCRRWRFLPASLWSPKWWMRAHVALGLVCLPTVMVHAGYGLGGPLSCATMVLFLGVIASGVWGLVLQQWLPQKLLEEVPDETVASQADVAARYYLGREPPGSGEPTGDPTGEVYRLVEAFLEPPPEPDELLTPLRLGGTSGGAAATTRMEPLVSGQPAQDLVAFRDKALVPYLERGRRSGSPLASQTESDRQFAQLRAIVSAEARPLIDRLAELADLRRRWDHQARISRLLHNWIPVHLGLSVAMTGLMLVHAVRALKYW